MLNKIVTLALSVTFLAGVTACGTDSSEVKAVDETSGDHGDMMPEGVGDPVLVDDPDGAIDIYEIIDEFEETDSEVDHIEMSEHSPVMIIREQGGCIGFGACSVYYLNDQGEVSVWQDGDGQELIKFDASDALVLAVKESALAEMSFIDSDSEWIVEFYDGDAITVVDGDEVPEVIALMLDELAAVGVVPTPIAIVD